MNLKNIVKSLSKSEKTTLMQLLSVDSMDETYRFKNGVICPHCKNTKCIRKGIIKGNQRYYCHGCKKYFTIYAKTILNYTKKSLDKWKLFIESMFESKPTSLKIVAEEIGIARITAFRWRHKILNMLEGKFNNDYIGGIVEADETFMLSSRKGKKVKGLKGRRRGGVSKYRGTSHEHTGVLVAVDRAKNIISKVYGTGKICDYQIQNILGKRIKENSILITDAASVYKSFATGMKLELKQVKGGHSRDLNINNVNSYHSNFKRWVRGFNGISTKYLDRYLTWYKFIRQKNDSGYLFNELVLA